LALAQQKRMRKEKLVVVECLFWAKITKKTKDKKEKSDNFQYCVQGDGGKIKN
jgi:hypothetical protein